MADIRISQPGQHSPRPEMSGPVAEPQYSHGSRLPWVILALVVVVLVVLGVLFRDKLFSKEAEKMTAGKPSGYQAVFLTNGQVYFGKASDLASKYVILKDIYYLQVEQQLQPVQNGQQQANQQQPQQRLTLVKLGNELHGPVDEMKINPNQILFIEDMKEEGKVMAAIRDNQKNPPGSTQAPANPQAPAGSAPAGGQATPPPAQPKQ